MNEKEIIMHLKKGGKLVDYTRHVVGLSNDGGQYAVAYRIGGDNEVEWRIRSELVEGWEYYCMANEEQLASLAEVAVAETAEDRRDHPEATGGWRLE